MQCAIDGVDELVDLDQATAVWIERAALGDRVAAERDADAEYQFVDGDVAARITIARAHR